MQMSNGLMRLQDIIPDLKTIKKLVEDYLTNENRGTVEKRVSSLDLPMQHVFRHTLVREIGNEKYLHGNYMDAISQYNEAASILLGSSGLLKVESPRFEDEYSEMYNEICSGNAMGGTFYMLSLVSCYNNVAQCHLKIGNHLEAIDWLQEIAKLYSLRDTLGRPDSYPWISSYPTVLEFPTYYIKSQMRLTEVFFELRNTASSAYCSYVCTDFGKNAYVGVEEIERLRKQSKLDELITLRHPDFRTSGEIAITSPKLQIRGSWTKVRAQMGYRPRNRSGFSSWIWRNTLYVFGGTDYGGRNKELIDIWCLDLYSMNSWRRLPDLPPQFDVHVTCIPNTKMCVWKDEAWLFFGSRIVLKFNLPLERWVLLETKWNSEDLWPYKNDMAVEYCAEIFEGKLHIFGGGDEYTSIGMNLHMRLDLKTLVWTELGGSNDPQAIIEEMPMFRKGSGSWVVPQEKRMYILYGHAARSEMDETEKCLDHQYEDMWSYSLVENKWKRERLRGNFPAPRTKMACSYHPGLNQVLVFGGCNMRLPIVDERFSRTASLMSFLGDTFVLDMKTRIWKHVLTHNFPHHRMYSQIAISTETGKIYLYGGSCSSDLMPSKYADKKTSRVSLGDLWRLDLNLPGENSDASDSKIKELVDGFGPWKLCFGCKEYKANVKKCGGVCGGCIYLCSIGCQRKSWEEHKHVHRCRR